MSENSHVESKDSPATNKKTERGIPLTFAIGAAVTFIVVLAACLFALWWHNQNYFTEPEVRAIVDGQIKPLNNELSQTKTQLQEKEEKVATLQTEKAALQKEVVNRTITIDVLAGDLTKSNVKLTQQQRRAKELAQQKQAAQRMAQAEKRARIAAEKGYHAAINQARNSRPNVRHEWTTIPSGNSREVQAPRTTARGEWTTR
jgi:septal ring factor EnvC (AmiA/AmiB activator)